MYIALGLLENMVVDFYSVEETNASEFFIDKAHNNGKEVHVWTINKEQGMKDLIDLGVDNIITDYDAMLRRVVDEKMDKSSIIKILEYKDK